MINDFKYVLIVATLICIIYVFINTNQKMALKTEVEDLKFELDNCKNSDKNLFNNVQLAFKQGNWTLVLNEFEGLKSRHPESAETKKAQELVNAANAELEKIKMAELEKMEQEQKMLAVEKADREKALNSLRKKYDDIDQITWYYNSYFTHYYSDNYVSLYMGRMGDGVPWLRFKASYTGDDWLFFDKIQISQGYSVKEVYFSDKKTEVFGGGNVAEWIDISPDEAGILLYLKELTRNNEPIKIRFSGKYTDTRTLRSSEVKALKQMLDAYEALGGKI